MSGTMMGQGMSMSGMSCPIPPQPTTAADPMLAVIAADAVVLYKDDGTIVHVYQATTLAGGTHPTVAQREKAARDNYEFMQPTATRAINVLHVAGFIKNQMCTNQTFKVVNCTVVPG